MISEWSADSRKRLMVVRDAYKDFRDALLEQLPEGRRRSLALTDAENSFLWAQNALAEVECPLIP